MPDLQTPDLRHDSSSPNGLSHADIVPAEHHENESRAMFAVAMAGISALFVLSVAMAISQISTGVKTASNGKVAPITAPETTGSGHRS